MSLGSVEGNLKFVPPKEEAQTLPRYASYVVGYGMKLHSRVCDAKNSFNNRGWTYIDTGEAEEVYGRTRPVRFRGTRHSFILENVEGEWFVLYEIAPGLKKDELPWVKEFYRNYSYGTKYDLPYDDHAKESDYYQQRLKDGSATLIKKAVPMSTDEYVQWRLAVERYRLGIDS